MNDETERRVFVIIGLYRPDKTLLTRQLLSIFGQSYKNVEVIVSSDGPLDATGREVVDGFSHQPINIIESEDRWGVHANFARGLVEAVGRSDCDTDLFAFCDQDDVWRQDKLERQVACFSDREVSLVHSDARIVDETGNVIGASLFEHEARARVASFLDILVMNSVTGMTSVFTREVARAAETFPLARCRRVLHDHWVALIASLIGSVHLVDETLVDYTQHSRNVRGARRWAGGWRRGMIGSRRRIYLRKCYRQFLWRKRALEALRKEMKDVPRAVDRLFGPSVQALFDCKPTAIAALRVSLVYRLHGHWRQADQAWRIWRGKLLRCPTPIENSKARGA